MKTAVLPKYFWLFLLFVVFGCNQGSKNASESQHIVSHNPKQQTEKVIKRKLIKKGWLEFETDNLKSTKKTILEAVDHYEGYVSSDEEYNSTGKKSNTVVIRIPAENFDNFLIAATKGVERFDRKEINVEDVTEEFLDIEARLQTKKKLEQRYIALLNQAKSVTEILEIEKEIGQLRSEIESIEGRLKYLQDKVSLSTLTITFYESISGQTQFGKKFKKGFSNGWNNLIWFFVALTNIWPFILIILGLIFGIKIYRRRK
ncbi:MAG TPA: DUF4349 domain-containing protein [Flavobacteriaceae bacterium]|nr:DUF4349 domain-containing protein [Flavobacteriaceae bacterium]